MQNGEAGHSSAQAGRTGRHTAGCKNRAFLCKNIYTATKFEPVKEFLHFFPGIITVNSDVRDTKIGFFFFTFQKDTDEGSRRNAQKYQTGLTLSF